MIATTRTRVRAVNANDTVQDVLLSPLLSANVCPNRAPTAGTSPNGSRPYLLRPIVPGIKPTWIKYQIQPTNGTRSASRNQALSPASWSLLAPTASVG